MNGQGQGQGKAEYQGHPLSSGGAPAYNQTTMSGARGAEGFYDSAAYWLGLYFFFNLGLTLFNKIVLVSFPFPYVSLRWTWRMKRPTLTADIDGAARA